jgi:hypothetical protein
MASSDSSRRFSSPPPLLAYPSLKIRYSTCITLRSLASSSPRSGNRNGIPEALIRCVALLMRCAIVASGTRKARAISAVVRPPTALRVRAIAEAGGREGSSTRTAGRGRRPDPGPRVKRAPPALPDARGLSETAHCGAGRRRAAKPSGSASLEVSPVHRPATSASPPIATPPAPRPRQHRSRRIDVRPPRGPAA